MKKRSLLLCLALVLSLTMAIGGTLAYLTDTEYDTNVMTLGNVDIELIENQLADDGETEEPFEQKKLLYPAVIDKDQNVVGGIDKIIRVKNTGDSDAYVRTFVAFPKLGAKAVTLKEESPIVVQYNKELGTPSVLKDVQITTDGVTETYTVFVFTYPSALAADKTSDPSLLGFYMNPAVTNEDLKGFNGEYRVQVAAQAMQTNNFEAVVETQGVDAAMKIAFPAEHPWTNGRNDIVTSIAGAGTTASGKVPSFGFGSESGEPITIDGEGSLVATTYQDLWISDDLTIKGVTFEEGLRINLAAKTAAQTAEGTVEPIEVVIEDCTIMATDQEKLKAANVPNFHLQSRDGLCFDIEPNGVPVKLIFKNNIVNGESTPDMDRDGYSDVNNRKKAGGKGVSIGEISGNSNGLAYALIENNTFTAIRGHAIQLYNIQSGVEIEILANHFVSWAQNDENKDFAVRGNYAENADDINLVFSKNGSENNTYDASRMTVDGKMIGLVKVDGYTADENDIQAVNE